MARANRSHSACAMARNKWSLVSSERSRRRTSSTARSITRCAASVSRLCGMSRSSAYTGPSFWPALRQERVRVADTGLPGIRPLPGAGRRACRASGLVSAGSRTRASLPLPHRPARVAVPGLPLQGQQGGGTMQTTFFTNGRPVTGRPPQSVVAVSGDLLRAELLDALIVDENDYGPIFLEPMTGAYSRIKEEMPDLVIVYCEADDDVAACQLLSML